MTCYWLMRLALQCLLHEVDTYPPDYRVQSRNRYAVGEAWGCGTPGTSAQGAHSHMSLCPTGDTTRSACLVHHLHRKVYRRRHLSPCGSRRGRHHRSVLMPRVHQAPPRSVYPVLTGATHPRLDALLQGLHHLQQSHRQLLAPLVIAGA